MQLRQQYQEELDELSYSFIRMGALVISAVDKAYQAVDTGERAVAAAVADYQEQTTTLAKKIEAMCLNLIVRQQPVAADLRRISAVFKMVDNLSAIGAAAGDIANYTINLPPQMPPRLGDIKKMAGAAREMVADAIKSYVGESMVLADYVIRRDEIVDGYFTSVEYELALFIAEEPNDADLALSYFMIVKYIERLADQAVELAEWIKFSKTGEHKNIKVF